MVAEEIHRGAVVVYPTDTAFALACHLGDKQALARIVRIRDLHKHHQFTLACRDLSELGTYGVLDNTAYRLLKSATPGPFTWVMRATRETPRRLLHAKRRTIGIRVPDHVVCQALLEAVGEPLLSTTVRMPGDELPLSDAQTIYERLNNRVDIILDDGRVSEDVSTVVDLSEHNPEIIRQGLGRLPQLED